MAEDISIVIPTYNRPEKTLRAVKSVLGRHDSVEIEVWVGDDGSTDNTVSLLKSSISDRRFHVASFNHVGDPGWVRNKTIEKTSGRFIAFLDSDDWWGPDRIERIGKLIRSKKLVLGLTGLKSEIHSDPFREILKMNSAVTSSAVIEKILFEKLGGFSEYNYGPSRKKLRLWEDYHLWIHAIRALQLTGQAHEIHIEKLEDVFFDGAQCTGVGNTSVREQMFREFNTLVTVAPNIRMKDLPFYSRRLVSALKATAFS